jgi:hypothetical protein
VVDAMTEATLRSGVALSLNLTSSVYVNQSAGFSEYHGTGANPAANASYTDSAFVANRFRVVQQKWPRLFEQYSPIYKWTLGRF